MFTFRQRNHTLPVRPHRRRRAALSFEALEGRTVPTFLAPLDLFVGEAPHGVTAADFDSDGALDLVVANALGSKAGVGLLFGTGGGAFKPPVGLADGRFGDVVTADFNGDVLPDLAFAGFAAWGRGVSVLLGNGDGTFRPVGEYAGDPSSLAAADLNGDGIVDLVNVTRVLLGNGDGTFRLGGALEFTGLHVAVADFNGDAIPDLVTPLSDSGILTFYFGNGDGTFQRARGISGDVSGRDAVAAGDFNADGLSDVAVTGPGRVSVFLGNGDGTFRPRRSFPAPSSTTSLAATDLDGDAILDFVAGGSVLLGNGDGTFGPAREYFVGSNPADVVVGDFNGDAAPDFAIANVGGGTLNVRLNNGDGTFARAPRYGQPDQIYWSVDTADLDGDGVLDLATTGGVLLGNGDGTFRDPVPYNMPGFPLAVKALGGGRLAVAGLGTGGARVSILAHNGGGSFRVVASHPLASRDNEGLIRMAVADLNNDGVGDLAVTDFWGVNVFLGSPDGTFQRTSAPRANTLWVASVTAADFNNDGHPDLALGHGSLFGGGIHRITLLAGNGDGTFQAAVDHEVGIDPIGVVAADFNGDGAADLAVLDQWGGRLYILRGRGDGTFQNEPPFRLTGGTEAFSLILGDFNNDGIPDLAATGDNGVGIRLGRGDGTFEEPQHYGATGFPLGLTAGDFNGDGLMDLAVAGEHGGIAVLLNRAV